jgi:hypothetical protein
VLVCLFVLVFTNLFLKEYSLLTRFKRPLGWPTGGYPGAQVIIVLVLFLSSHLRRGLIIAETALIACLDAPLSKPITRRVCKKPSCLHLVCFSKKKN